MKTKYYIEVTPVVEYLNDWLSHFDRICTDPKGKRHPVYRRGIVLAIKNFVEGRKTFTEEEIWKMVEKEKSLSE